MQLVIVSSSEKVPFFLFFGFFFLVEGDKGEESGL